MSTVVKGIGQTAPSPDSVSAADAALAKELARSAAAEMEAEAGGNTAQPEARETSETPETPETIEPKEPGWELHVSELSADSQDALLGSLVALTKIFGSPMSAESLITGLPLEKGRLTPGLFQRAAERAGLSSRIVRRNLEDIPDVVLPVVLLLNNRSACVLVRRTDDAHMEVIMPETGGGAETIPMERLAEIHDGYAIFVRPEFHFQKHAQKDRAPSAGSWFWGTLNKFWGTYSQVILAAILINSFAIASPLFVMNVYDRVVPNRAIETLWVLAVGIATVIGFDFLLRTLRGYFVDNAGKRADVLLSARIFEQVLNIQMAAKPASAGGFANQLRDFESLRDFFTSATLITLVDLPFLAIFLLIIYMIGGPVAYVPMAAVPLVILGGLIVQYPLRHAIRKSQEETAQKQGVVVETIGALETIKSLGAEGRMQAQWERFVGQSAKTGLTARTVSQLGINLASTATQLVTVGVVVFGVHQIAAGEMTIGALIACTILSGRTMMPLAQVAGLLSRLHQSMAALKMLNEIMALPVEREPGKRYLSRNITSGAIEFQNVTFTYPGGDVPALKEVSFRIEPGERVGILGPIGSGKTTISKLLINIYQPQEGAVLIEGTDVRQIDPADIRRAIGVTMQDVLLFHASMRDNIAMGAPHADDDQILSAATLAGVHEFVSHHPHGYDMQVGERGQTLSGGQRQCIALARALLPNPPILMLDEPTSMMDMASERQFAERLKKTLTDKTLILVTHRPSLFHLVDRLIVMGQGKIVADGPREVILGKAKQASRARKEG